MKISHSVLIDYLEPKNTIEAAAKSKLNNYCDVVIKLCKNFSI